MHPIFLDVETTELGENARIVQLAYKNADTNEVVNELFKPPTTISFGAMAIHHVTNEMVADKPSFQDSPEKTYLTTALQENIFVAHNAPFDMGVLNAEGVTVPFYIDTLRVAQHLLDSEEYKLQYLRYSLDLKAEGAAHDALGDINVLEALYYHLANVVKRKNNIDQEDEVLAYMQDLSQKPVLQKIFMFGKHKGKTFEEIAHIDMGYLTWLYNSESSKPQNDQNESLVYTLKTHLNA
jgi:exodeoxyribonuclease X